MKLKNKRSGEIKEFVLFDGKNELQGGVTLESLTKEWEDVPEEPKGHWYIAYNGTVGYFKYDDDWQYMDFNWQDKIKQIGNSFETKEEAEKAVEKLKAWKRLKDKGFSFHGYDDGYKHDFNSGHIEFYVENSSDVLADLDLLFSGGKE